MANFQALILRQHEDKVIPTVQELALTDLPKGEVLIRATYSGVNYKDALACLPDGKVVKSYPFIPGIDVAGVVVESCDPRFRIRAGDEVLVSATSPEFGVTHFGGFSQYVSVPAHWVLPLPKGLSAKEAMALGTAGITALLAVHELEKNGLKPDNGPVVVTGATGGVSSIAISILAKLGYNIVASTGKVMEHDYLKALGAKEILRREDIPLESKRPWEKELWAGSVDSVGGSTLAYLIRNTKFGGAVAACGNASGASFEASVFPFIMRGVKLLGICSICPEDLRQTLWERLATDLKPVELLNSIAYETTLAQLPHTIQALLESKSRGRAIVNLA